MNVLRNLFRSQFGWALLAGAAIGTASTVVFLNSRTPALAEPAQTSMLGGNELSMLATLDSAGTKLVEQVSPSVVLVKTNRGEGSGVVYRADGYIMTNAHVVGGADKVSIEFHDGKTETGTVLRDEMDSYNDIAIVKVDRSDLQPARFADSGTVRPGQLAIAIGAPFGLAESVSFGHVSALGRQNFIPDRGTADGVRAYFNMIQTDAAINPGNSGGPLMNYKGEVIGINTAINTMTGASSGVGFAIPANTAKLIAEQLLTKGKITRAYIGVIPADLKGYEVAKLGIKEGAILRQVPDGGPAKNAGLREGDVVIEIAGKQIRGEQDLRDAMLLNIPGKNIEVKAVRGGRTQTFTVKASSRPAPTAQPTMPQDEELPFFNAPGEMPQERPQDPDAAQPVRLGVQVRELTAEEKSLAPNKTGVMVVSVEPNSPAAIAGVKPGVVITQLGDTRISSPDVLKSTISKFKRGDATMLTFGRAESAGSMVVSTTVRF